MHNVPKLALVVTAATCLSFSAWVSAQSVTYRWVDAQGVTHYTQAPPPAGVEFNKIVSKAEKPSKPTGAEGDAANSAEGKPVDAEMAAQKKACENARKNVTLLSSDTPVRAARPAASTNGSAATASDELMTAEQRAVELRRAQLQVELNCE